MHERMTNPGRGQQDTDMLTDKELEERGYETRFTKLTEGPKTQYKGDSDERKCHFCNRKMNAPVSKFEKFGIDFVPDGKLAHEGCARRQFDLVKKQLQLLDQQNGA